MNLIWEEVLVKIPKEEIALSDLTPVEWASTLTFETNTTKSNGCGFLSELNVVVCVQQSNA